MQENKFLKKIYERHPPRSATTSMSSFCLVFELSVKLKKLLYNLRKTTNFVKVTILLLSLALLTQIFFIMKNPNKPMNPLVIYIAENDHGDIEIFQPVASGGFVSSSNSRLSLTIAIIFGNLKLVKHGYHQ